MIKILLTLSLISSINLAQAFEASADDLLGYWLSEKGEAVIRVYKDKEEFKGDIVWLKAVHTGEFKKRLDENNPDESKRGRNLIGVTILEGFEFDGGRWINGTIYDAKSGKIYSAKMKLEDKNNLNLRGYVGISLFGRTSKWTRQEGKVPKKYQ